MNLEKVSVSRISDCQALIFMKVGSFTRPASQDMKAAVEPCTLAIVLTHTYD